MSPAVRIRHKLIGYKLTSVLNKTSNTSTSRQQQLAECLETKLGEVTTTTMQSSVFMHKDSPCVTKGSILRTCAWGCDEECSKIITAKCNKVLISQGWM